MKKSIFSKIKASFSSGGRLEKFGPIYEALESFIFRMPVKTIDGAHMRDPYDIKRMMTFVIISLFPAFIFGTYNVGYQFYTGVCTLPNHLHIFLKGLIIVAPIFIVSYVSGGICEVIFAIIRKHEINEGFLVTGFLIPLILPPTIPLWQVALATVFAVVLGKEVFGGTGMNIFNPALLARAFIFFSYPKSMSGNKVWTYMGDRVVDSFSMATPLAVAAESKTAVVDVLNHNGYSFIDMLLGIKPGCIGETSILAILMGAILLIITGVASWRIILSVFAGGFFTVLVLNFFAPSQSSMMAILPHYHFVMGGFAFGAVFMATDPVSSSATRGGKYIYGLLIGVLAILIRVFNPAYTEGMMMAILFMNIFAPLIDYIIIRGNMKRRRRRAKV